MWLDAFRSEAETLIAWRPGNVLMKNTQGVVSSEDICYSCHDGYVNDSRDRVWKYKRHSTFVKPSKSVTVPPSLPLSNKNEIYCGTCHTPHSAATDAKAGVTAISTFLREVNLDSRLCGMCHTEQARFGRNKGHPLGVMPAQSASALPSATGLDLGDNRKIICQTCHRVHGARGDTIVAVPNRNSELCTTCHREHKGLLNTKHDLRLTMPSAVNIKQQPPADSGPCGACHIPHGSANEILWARQYTPGGPTSQLCLGCHDEDNPAQVKWIGRYSHPVDVRPSAGLSLHDKLPLFSDNAVRDASGKVACFTCHSVHRWDPDIALNTGAKEVDGDASNSFLRISNFRSSELCLACHENKKQVRDSDHYLEVTAPKETNLSGLTPEESGPCGTCHIVHNAAGINLWARELHGPEDLTSQLCTGCHDKSGPAAKKTVGPNTHPVAVPIDRLSITAPVTRLTQRLPLYDGSGDKAEGKNVACMTCHEPHTWDPKNPRPNSQEILQNKEGDNTDSFLRIVNAPSSMLCRFCHVDKAAVDGTDHDLNVSAPQAKNLRDQTVTSSGQCGACHLVHNSPHTIALWSRSMGPVGNTGSNMDALCTSCHFKKGVANKAVPQIASHPREKLIINTIPSRKKTGSYTPVFDDTGEKVAVGNISCPSCHNAHQWGYLAGTRTDPEYSQGTGASKFLRTTSDNAICVNCHGPEAAFRYLYFHEPEQRIAVSP
jgi:predicted CXXCH cytochrome family protein